jgi:hypothetical protein
MLKTFGESSSDVKSHDFMRTYAAKIVMQCGHGVRDAETKMRNLPAF